MEEKTIKQIILSLKRLIKELKSGYCNNLSSEQINRLERGFSEILEVEKEISYGRIYTNSNDDRSLFRSNFIHNVFSSKKKRNKN